MKWILITGASKKLGKNISENFAKDNFNLCLHYNNSEKEILKFSKFLEEKYKIKVKIFKADFLKDLEVEKFIKSMKNQKINLYGIVNNASRYFINSLSKTSDEEFLKLFKTNFLTPFKIIKNLKIENGGFIINIGLVGIFKNFSNTYFPAYFISKQALLTATKSFAREFLEKNIRVNMVSPGILENFQEFPESEDNLLLKRFGKFQDVSEIISFLASDKSEYITGQNIEVAGGFTL